MSTYWTYPNKVSQSVEEGAQEVHVPWSDLDVVSIILNDKVSLSTSGSLYHIARSPKHDILSKTFYLKLTDFKFQDAPATLSGIELRIDANRRGRIMDETVQLLLDDQIIGENKASTDITPNNLYGSPTDKWDTNLTMEQISKSSFGVVLRFKSHPKWPHKDPILINRVELRIH